MFYSYHYDSVNFFLFRKGTRFDAYGDFEQKILHSIVIMLTIIYNKYTFTLISWNINFNYLDNFYQIIQEINIFGPNYLHQLLKVE